MATPKRPSRPPRPLSVRESKLLADICEHWDRHGCAPTIRELIAEGRSYTWVRNLVANCLSKGVLFVDERQHVARTLRPTPAVYRDFLSRRKARKCTLCGGK